MRALEKEEMGSCVVVGLVEGGGGRIRSKKYTQKKGERITGAAATAKLEHICSV